MRPFLPPSPTLSFPSFRPLKARSPKIPAVSALPASFNLRRRQPRRIQSLSHLAQFAEADPLSRAASPSENPHDASSKAFRKGHRKSKSSGGSGGSMNALRMANDMLPAGLRLARREEGSLLPTRATEGELEDDVDDDDEAAMGEEYEDSDLAIESALAALWNSGCLLYLISPDDAGALPSPSPLFAGLRLAILALVLLPLLLALSSGARCLSAKAEDLSREKSAGVWAATVGSGVGIYSWSRYVMSGWAMSSPWVAYQALVLAIAIVGIVYNSIVRRPCTLADLHDDIEPLEYDLATPPGSPRQQDKAASPTTPVRSPVRSPIRSPARTPGRGTPLGSRESLVAMLA